MKKVKLGSIWVIALVASFPILCGVADANGRGKTSTEKSAKSTISVKRLLSESSAYNGKEVKVSGLFQSEFESSTLTDESASQGEDKALRQIWVEVNMLKGAQVGELRGKEVVITGKFTAGSSGHMGAWNGSISAERIELLSTKSEKK